MITRLFSSSYFILLILSGFITTEKQEKKYTSQRNQVLIRYLSDTSFIQVNPVSYGQFNWEYWGFTNDWLQQEVVSDLNAYYHKKNVRFIVAEEARSKNIKADKIIEISFSNIEIGQLKQLRSTDQRTRKIIVGYGNTNLEKPVYQTVSAVISYEVNYVDNNAILQCRIYDPAKDINFMSDNFEEKYQWTNRTATYTGNEVAISDYDRTIINNSYKDVPPKNELAQKLIRNCYTTLISKIKTKVKF